MRFSIRTGTAVLAAAALLQACGGGGDDASSASVGSIKVLSNRADLVSGGDALVELVPRSGMDPSQLKLDVGGVDVTSAFALRANGRFMGLVTGLANGENRLTAKLADGSATTATITNYPVSGAILYGPQIQPWTCDAGALDANCNRAVRYAFKYMSSNPALTAFRPYDPANPPTDIATTTTDAGKSVPFIVRVETGVQDRDYYNIAVLFDPAKTWTAWAPQEAWNRKLFIVHGVGCGNGFAQSNALSAARVLDRTAATGLTAYTALSRGAAVLSVALNDSGHNCNIAVQAEATMMAKERVVEAYGELRYTFGYGGSGGAIAQQWMSNAYPGLYNGIIVSGAYPDSGSTNLEVEDCALLRGYFARSATAWTEGQQAAASGHLNTGVCAEWVDFYKFNNGANPAATNLVTLPNFAPTATGGCDLPAAAKFDATLNPGGVRCSSHDLAASIFGKQSDGRANRPWSNIGVQYGLTALQAGRITVEQFVDLNASIGSHTLDYDFQPSRTAATEEALNASYRSGHVNEGHGMGKVAIIDARRLDITGIHHQYRSWAMRERLDRANGGHRNHVIWFGTGTPVEALAVMDTWLTAVERDTGNATLEQKLVTNRPLAANDRCGASEGAGLTMLQCTGAADGSTRMAAGASIADDVIECQLKAMDRAGYGAATFTDAQWARLQGAFPAGVCDFSKPGRGQQPAQPWQTYLRSDGSVIFGGAPLPAAP